MKENVKILLVVILLLLGGTTNLYAQNEYEVVKIRGKIYSNQGYLKIGSRISYTEEVFLTSTSDVMLLKKGKYYYFFKHHNFVSDISKGKPLNGYKNTMMNITHSELTTMTARVQPQGLVSRRIECKSNGKEYWVDTETSISYDIDTEESWKAFDKKYKVYNNTLLSGESLNPGDKIMSGNCQYSLRVTSLGNLELLNGYEEKVLWSTGTSGLSPRLTLNDDGKLRLTDSYNNVIWEVSGTSDSKCSYLKLEDDGNLILRNLIDWSVIWETRTWNGSMNSKKSGHNRDGLSTNFTEGQHYSIKSTISNNPLGFIYSGGKDIPSLSDVPNDLFEYYWVLTKDSTQEKSYRIKHKKYLIAKSDGSEVHLRNNYMGDNRKYSYWDITYSRNRESCFIRNLYTGLYLEVSGNAVQLAPFTGLRNQKWKIEPIN